jgi:hypothetical protein
MSNDGAGHLAWELTLPDVPDRWRAVANGIMWGVSRMDDAWWHVSRWPQVEPNPTTVGVSPTLEAGQALAQELADAAQQPGASRAYWLAGGTMDPDMATGTASADGTALRVRRPVSVPYLESAFQTEVIHFYERVYAGCGITIKTEITVGGGRADVVVEGNWSVHVVECKPSGSFGGLGQAIVYRQWLAGRYAKPVLPVLAIDRSLISGDAYQALLTACLELQVGLLERGGTTLGRVQLDWRATPGRRRYGSRRRMPWTYDGDLCLS